MMIFIIVLILIFLSMYIVIISSFNSIKRDNNELSSQNISIVIAAKNEEPNIAGLIDSLKKLNYPSENFEIIFVDDNSADQTLKLLQSGISEIPNFIVVSAHTKKYPGKKGALDIGISKANYDNIMITDADCRPEPEWLSTFSGKFSHGFDLVFGTAPFIKQNSVVNKLSRFENLKNTILSFGLAQAGLPYSAASRSFGFKKIFFDKIDGYGNTLQTIGGDDDLLIREAVKHKAKFGIVMDEEAFVYSSTETTWKNYFKQKFRHLSTSNYYSINTKLILALWHFLNILFLFSPLLIFFDEIFVLPLVVKLLLDIFSIKYFQKKISYEFKFSEIFYLQILYEIFLIVNYIGGLFRKKEW